jgi:surface protein
MPIFDYVSNKDRFIGTGVPVPLPLEKYYNPQSYAGSILYGEDGAFYYSNGGELWVPLLEVPIDRPAAKGPLTAVQQTQLRLTSFRSGPSFNLTHESTRFEVSRTADFGVGDIIFSRTINVEDVEDPTMYQITLDDGLSFGQEFFWRGVYIAQGFESEASTPFLQTYPLRAQDPTAVTLSNTTTDLLQLSAFETAFPDRFAFLHLQYQIFSNDGGVPGDTALHDNTIPDQTGDIDISSLGGFFDGDLYHWRARYYVQDTLLDQFFYTSWTEYRTFFSTPSTLVLEYDLRLGEPSSREIYLPIAGSANVSVDWGDGSIQNGVTGAVTHTYAVSHGDIAKIRIAGSLPNYGIDNVESFSDSQLKLRTVNAIGDELGLTNLAFAFDGCYNLINVPSTISDGITSFYATFKNCTSFNAPIGNWNVGYATGLGYAEGLNNMFSGCTAFNQNLSKWNIGEFVADGSKIGTAGMFRNCIAYNQPMPWDMSKVSETNSMFEGCREFNQSLNDWDTSSFENTSSMFLNASSFNRSINDWDMSNVKIAHSMFQSAVKFNQDLDDWDLDNLTDAGEMFYNAQAFNGDISTWVLPELTNVYRMFRDARAFNRDISSWNVNSISDFSEMFLNAWAFNQDLSTWFNSTAIAARIEPLESLYRMFYGARAYVGTGVENWDTSTVEDMTEMFLGASKFNGDVSGWDVSAVGTDSAGLGGFASMFQGAASFDQDMSGWCANNSNAASCEAMFYGCTDLGKANGGAAGLANWMAGTTRFTSLASFFRNCSNFDENLSAWDVSAVENLSLLFDFADKFNNGDNSGGGIDSWDVSSVTRLDSTFRRARAFDRLVDSWDVSKVTTFANTFYDARSLNQTLTSWGARIGQDIPAETYINMSHMFYNADAFNQNLDSWATNMIYVSNIGGMFYGARIFNNGDNYGESSEPGIGNWDISNVTNMYGVFRSSPAFNQDIGSWVTSSATSMRYMFNAASSFNQDISSWNTSNVTDMERMFNGASAFNQDITGWNVSNVEDFQYMFANASAFDQDLASNWNISAATNVLGMFENADSFTNGGQPMTGWNNSWGNVESLKRMFRNTAAFNADVTGWDISNVKDITRMFDNALAFNQNIGSWDITEVTLMSEEDSNGNLISIFTNTPALTDENYSNILVGWEAQEVNDFVRLVADTCTATGAGELARTALITDHNWTIIDESTP